MAREFSISEKTPNRSLLTAKWNQYPIKERVARDICKNTRELAPEADLDCILRYMSYWRRGTTSRYVGISAIAHSVASPIGSSAAKMGWATHSPEVVYMGSYHILWVSGVTLEKLEQQNGNTQKATEFKTNREILVIESPR